MENVKIVAAPGGVAVNREAEKAFGPLGQE
jgi:hypothetical protein